MRLRDWKSIVCKVGPKIRAEIINRRNTLRIENRSCPVRDRFHVQQCGNCLRFGHKSSACREDQPSCAHCNEKHHIKDCPSKNDPEKLMCSNCATGSAHDDDLLSGGKHNAYNHSSPVYTKRMKHQIERTNWGDGPIPSL